MHVLTTKAIGTIPAGSQGILKSPQANAHWKVKITHLPDCTSFQWEVIKPKDYFKPGKNCP